MKNLLEVKEKGRCSEERERCGGDDGSQWEKNIFFLLFLDFKCFSY